MGISMTEAEARLILAGNERGRSPRIAKLARERAAELLQLAEELEE